MENLSTCFSFSDRLSNFNLRCATLLHLLRFFNSAMRGNQETEGERKAFIKTKQDETRMLHQHLLPVD
jgi:hypothetical protein